MARRKAPRINILKGVRGQRELMQNLEAIRKAGTESKEVVDVLLSGGFVVRDSARARAPVLKKAKKGRVPGTLRKAVFVGRGDVFRDPRGPTVMVGINQKMAPHWHFTELGTKYIPAQHWFEIGVQAGMRPAADKIEAGVKRLIEKAAKRGRN